MTDHGRKIRAGSVEHGSTKLSMEKAEEIRARVAAGERRQDLADEYGVCLAAVGQIVRDQTWRK